MKPHNLGLTLPIITIILLSCGTATQLTPTPDIPLLAPDQPTELVKAYLGRQRVSDELNYYASGLDPELSCLDVLYRWNFGEVYEGRGIWKVFAVRTVDKLNWIVLEEKAYVEELREYAEAVRDTNPSLAKDYEEYAKRLSASSPTFSEPTVRILSKNQFC